MSDSISDDAFERFQAVCGRFDRVRNQSRWWSRCTLASLVLSVGLAGAGLACERWTLYLGACAVLSLGQVFHELGRKALERMNQALGEMDRLLPSGLLRDMAVDPSGSDESRQRAFDELARRAGER